MTFRPLSRRTMLRGSTGVAIGLPLLEAMEARAQTASRTKRYVFMFSPNGTNLGAWPPSGGETTFTLGRILGPLEPYRAKLLVLNNINVRSALYGPGDDHMKGMGHMLTSTELQNGSFVGGGGTTGGWAGGISVDQEIARRVGTTTRFRSLELGVQVRDNTVWGRMSYLGAGQPLPPENSPLNVFNRLFGNFSAPTTTTIDPLKVRRRSVLDAVQAEFNVLNAKLGSFDRQKLDAHLTAVREVELRVTANAEQVTTTACVKPGTPATMDYLANANYPAVGKLQMDLLAMALACDLTRIVTLQWAESGSQAPMPWIGVSQSPHDLGHAPDTDTAAQEKITTMNRWYAEQYAYLIGKLQSISEGANSLLDNSVVVWGNELAKGNIHSHNPVPFVLAGSCGGYFRTGRYLTAPTLHSNLHVSCLNAMGVPATTFGNPAHCTGPMANLT